MFENRSFDNLPGICTSRGVLSALEVEPFDEFTIHPSSYPTAGATCRRPASQKEEYINAR